MASLKFHRAGPPFGLEISEGAVRLLQLERTRAGVGVRSHATAPLPVREDPFTPERVAEIVEAVAPLTANGRFTTRRCVVGLPGSALRVRSVRQPRMPAADADKALRIEASERLGFGADEPAQVGWLRAGEVRHGEQIREEVILTGCERTGIERLVQGLFGAGLCPTSVEPSFCAAARAVGAGALGQRDPEAVRLLVEVGPISSTVLMLRGGEAVFYKRIGIGGRDFTRVAGERLDLDAETIVELRDRRMRAGVGAGETPAKVDRALFDAIRPLTHRLAEEVALCLRYYTVTFCGRRPNAALLGGEEAGEPGLVEAMSETLNIDASVARPFEGVALRSMERDCPNDGALAAWCAAFGLSARGLSPARRRRRAA